MKKTWFALLLTQCLIVAAYPIYENELDEYEDELSIQEEQFVNESEAVHVKLHVFVVVEEPAARENEDQGEVSVVHEEDAWEEEVRAAAQKPVQREVPYNRSLQRKRMQRAYEATVQEEEASNIRAASAQRKQSIAVSKRVPMKKNSSAKGNGASRSQVQKSRQNSDRPRVTQRKQGERRMEKDQIEADAQPESGSLQEDTLASRFHLLREKRRALSLKRNLLLRNATLTC
jgi:hypothetical protein